MHLLVLIKYQINIKMHHSHLLVLRNNQIDIKKYHSHLTVLRNNQIDIKIYLTTVNAGNKAKRNTHRQNK